MGWNHQPVLGIPPRNNPIHKGILGVQTTGPQATIRKIGGGLETKSWPDLVTSTNQDLSEITGVCLLNLLESMFLIYLPTCKVDLKRKYC